MRILVDLDGVCADFYGTVLRWYNAEFNDDLKYEEVTGWGLGPKTFRKVREAEEIRKYFRIKGFWAEHALIKDCDTVLERLQDKGHEIVIVTALPGDSDVASWGKHLWVKKHLPFLNIRNVVMTKRKDVVVGDILFDDGPHNLKAYPGTTCAMDYPFNRKIYTNYRVKTWLGFEKVIEGMCSESSM